MIENVKQWALHKFCADYEVKYQIKQCEQNESERNNDNSAGEMPE
jgi:hypothetical protein